MEAMIQRMLLGVAAGVGLVAFLTIAPLRAHDQFRFVGAVVAVDSRRTTVSVKFKEFDGKDETVKVAILATTEITRGKKKIQKSELKRGSSVVVDALGDDYENLEAVRIQIVPSPAK